MKKKWVLMTLIVLCVSLFSVPAFAAGPRVFDYADLLTEDEEMKLQQMSDATQEYWNMDLAYLTTVGTEGMSVKEYGAQFYLDNGFGAGVDKDGVILVVDMETRDAQIVTCGAAIDIFTDFYIEEIWDNMSGDFSDGNFFAGMETLYYEMDYYLAEYQKYLADPEGYMSEYQQAEKEAVKLFSFVVAIPASLLIAAIGVFIMKCGNNNIQNFTDGRAYLKQNGFYLTEDKSIFAGTHTSRVPIPKDDDHGSSRGGGSWGGSSSTFSRGGRSFGGGGGKF